MLETSNSAAILSPPPPGSIAEPVVINGRTSVFSTFTKLIGKAGRGAFWPLADQGAVSLGNILTVFLVGRWLDKAEFGTFALILEGLFFLVSLHAGLITYPLTVKGAVAEGASLRRLTCAALQLTLVLALPMAVVSLALAQFYHMLAIGVVAVVALIGWQLQEVVRRALLSHFRYSEAIWGDALTYVGQAVLLLLLGRAGRLTLMTALGSMAVTSYLTFFVQAAQVGIGALARGELFNTASDFWVRGRWIALSNSSTLGLMVCGNWALGLSHGTEQVADFAAIAALLKICNPVLQTISNVIVPASAKALDRGGMAAARRVAFKISAMAGLLLAPVLLLLAVAPEFCLRLAFHDKYTGPKHQEALRFVVSGYSLLYLVTAVTSFLNGVHRTRYTFYGQLAGSISMFVILLPLNIEFGWLGYAAGGVLPVLIQLLVLLWFARKVE
jgi:O-antigen/teichoic acid export membrane protein